MSFPPVPAPFRTMPGKLFGCRIAWLLIMAMFCGTVAAQNSFHHKLRSAGIVMEGRLYYGWTLDHHIEITPYKRHYPAFEISALKATYGKTRWEYMYNYPLIGFSYWYSDLGGTKPLGSAHAIFPFINFPLLRSKEINLYFRLGVGLAYLTRRYDRYDNFENLAIGSHLNGAVNLLLEARFRVSKRFMASGGISLMHFSNGAIKQPNYGLNMPAVNLALAYRLSRENAYTRKKLLPELYPFEFDGRRFLQLDINMAFGIKDLQSTLGGGNQYAVVAIYSNLLWPVSFKSRIGFGVDLSYDGSDEKMLEIRGVVPDHRINLVKTGVTGAYELAFSRMAIMLNLGVNFTGQYKRDGYVYEKLALRFGFTEQLFGSLALKAYYGKADYVTLGLGYKLPIKYYR